MSDLAVHYQERVMKELGNLKPRQVKRVLDFIEELKETPTEHTLVRMLGQAEAGPERFERVCQQLVRQGMVKPRLLKQLEEIAQARISASTQQCVDRLLWKNQVGILKLQDRAKLDRLVTEAELLALEKAQAMAALKFLREAMTGNGGKVQGP
ncbi:MAG: hypothetical protein HY318_05160 [Armatimonadetes bacterium]|nr:hypothetical protein [Armatimonadota bacterium]